MIPNKKLRSGSYLPYSKKNLLNLSGHLSAEDIYQQMALEKDRATSGLNL